MSNKVTDKFLSTLNEHIQETGMCSGGDRWLLAVSGGPDSMALLHGLVKLRHAGACRIEYFHVAHLNHQLRAAQSDDDADFVQQQVQNLDLDFTIAAVDVLAAAQRSRASMETEARNQRYRFLAQTAREKKCNKIALGHNADDNAETILHRIIRGTALRGLAGIPAVRKFSDDGGADNLWLVRPLLTTRRHEIIAYLQQQGICYRQDHSNQSLLYTRNRIRHELIPQLARQYNPNITEMLLQLGRTADWLGEMLSEDAAGLLAEIKISDDGGVVILDAGKLAQKIKLEQAEIVHQVLLELKVPLRKVGFIHIYSVLNLVKGDGTKVQLPGGWVVCREAEKLIFRPDPGPMDNFEYPDLGRTVLRLPGTTVLEPGWVWLDGGQIRPLEQIEAQWFEGGLEVLEAFRRRKTPAQEMIDLDKIEGKLVLRQRRRGDRFRPLGAPGEKKLGDFFTDTKVPLELRDRTGLLCDDQGIIWVMGLRLADRAKVTAPTKRILKLTIR